MSAGYGSVPSARRQISGSFGMTSATHWIPCQVATGILRRGGNAYDAAVAAGFAFQVVEPHMNGLGGEAVILGWPGASAEPFVVCGQGVAPQGATPAAMAAAGVSVIPGTGPLSAVVPGAFDAWMVLLKQYGTLALDDVLEPAISYALSGFPATEECCRIVGRFAQTFREHWKSSGEIFTPQGSTPVAGDLMRNEPLARTYRTLLDAAKARGIGREGQIEAARFAFYQGFVAEQVDQFVAAGPIPDASGKLYSGFLRGSDMADWHATIEPATAFRFRGLTIYKPGPWSQGPVLLQTLALLDQLDSSCSMGANNAHLLVEAMKLAFADREAWYGDSNDDPPPIERLLSKPYNEARASLIGESASKVLVPGALDGCVARLPAFELKEERKSAKRASFDRDTCHLNVIDRWGNIVSATPSGGWLYGSPALPGLGLCLSTRGQMFWLQPGLASSLRPGRRPRTTISPTLLVDSSGARMALGTKGADYADQWLLQFIINHYVYGFDLQSSVDGPLLASEHWPDSVAPRRAAPNRLLLDNLFPEPVREALRARGHDVAPAPEGRFGRTCVAALRNGVMYGAVTTRLLEAAVIGR